MANLWVTEFEDAELDGSGNLLQAVDVSQTTTQKATFTGTAGAISNAVGDRTSVIRVFADANACIKVAGSPTATTSDIPITAGQAEYFSVPNASSLKVSAITR